MISQGVLSQSSAGWTSTISCSSSELEELFDPLPQKETHLRAGGRGELRGEALLTMRQPFMVAADGPELRESGRGSREDKRDTEKEEEERKDCSVIFALSCFILARPRPYWAGKCFGWILYR